MRNDEIVSKNISLTFDFMRKVIDDPDILSAIPDGSEIDFIETDLPRYTVKNRVKDAVEPVVFRVEHTFHGIVAEK